MSSVTVFPVITVVLFGVVVLIAFAIILSSERRKLVGKKRYTSVIGNARYTSDQFSRQMELDMRLPYRRFKQLYPYSTWNYEEYKKMQKQTAFRRSTSAQDNKRMVR